MSSNTPSESRLRRQAKRLGYIVRKSRKRTYHYDNQGGWAVISPDYNYIIYGDKLSLSIE